MNCPSCHKRIPTNASSCPTCGFSFDEATRRLGSKKPPLLKQREKESVSSTSFDSIDNARFVPGTILAERYRIVGLLGKGGMGEVYRADDLKLGQPVALKFISDQLARDPQSLARLYREVRVARQVSHPNVCRVYDIGEIQGQHFLSMEFVKGEELSSLVHRIGRLPVDKATEIARQICAGLAAAHNRGVLHRDLKPANVMIDEHGNARLTDFGIAAMVEEISGDEVGAGTPAYMSPEQLAGKKLTTKSDIYSLGLVLYELFTGKRAFDAPSLPQLLSLRHSDATPTTPSSLIKNLNPLIERVILRCLENDPDKRPASALQVASALPGGDPLAAALAMGETPSPEAVAGAPTEGRLKPAVAITCFGGVVLLLALVLMLSGRTNLLNVIPSEKSPEVLAERAREINRRLGYISRATDTAQGFAWDRLMDLYINRDRSPARWEVLKSGDAPVFNFWYLQSPSYLVGQDRFSVGPESRNAPYAVSGMSETRVDLQGRLLFFRAVPPQLEDPPAVEGQLDWSILFKEAGLDISNFREVASRWTPPETSDVREAWDGVLPGKWNVPVHIEAAAFHGKPIYFNIIYSWNRPLGQEQRQPGLIVTVMTWLGIGLPVVAVLGATLVGLRNARLGLSDQHGAFRLALYIFVLSLLQRMLVAHHVPILNAEFNILQEHLAWALLWTVTIWILYLALEPFLRGHWPHYIISWKRFLSGEIHDPLVGRDLMLGILLGFGLDLILESRFLLPRLFGWPEPIVARFAPNTLTGVRAQTSQVLESLQLAPLTVLIGLFVLLLFTIILRKRWLAAIAVWVLTTPLGLTYTSNIQTQTMVAIFLFGIFVALFIFALMRFGLLTATVAFFTWHILSILPLTTNFSSWFASATILVSIVLVGIAFFGFYISLERRPAL